MFKMVYKNCLSILAKKPIRLWGLSLLSQLLSVLACVMGLLPIIYVPVSLVLSAGMCMVFLDGYNKKEVSADQIFAGFRNNFWHVAGGMCWMYLWIFIWALIPVVGPVFAVIKYYSYRFTPYILMKEPEVSATEALRLSMKKTEGYRGKMFVTDLLAGLAIYGTMLILALLVGLFIRIDVIALAVLFGIIYFAAWLVAVAFGPLFFGLVGAAFYEEIPKLPPPAPKPQKPVAAGFCGNCGAPLTAGQRFCAGCGAPIQPPEPPAE